jgi:hypothetical protein
MCNDLVDVIFTISKVWLDFTTYKTLLGNFNSSLSNFQSFLLCIPNQINEVMNLLWSVSYCKLLFLTTPFYSRLFFQQPIQLPLLFNVNSLIFNLLSCKHLFTNLPNILLNTILITRIGIEHLLHLCCV